MAALPLLLLLLILLLHGRMIRFFCDDAYISFRYAENLANGAGLVYNEGERVEGYTNFLWVLLIGAGLGAGASAEWAALLLGALSLLVVLLMTAVLARRLLGRSPGWTLLPSLLLVAQGPVVLWALAGLETMLFTALVLGAITAYARLPLSPRSLIAAGFLFGLATLARPEGVVFAAAVGVHLFLLAFRREGEGPPSLLRWAASLAAGLLVVVLPFLLWRYAYYGEWLPNTYYAKTGESVRFDLGIRYLLSFGREYPALPALAAAGILFGLVRPRDPRTTDLLLLLLLVLAAFLGAVVIEGGDYMALYRFLVPVLPIAALLAGLALHRLATITAGSGGRRWVVGGVHAALLAGLLVWLIEPSFASARGEERSRIVVSVARMRENTRRWKAVGKGLEKVLWPDATIATSAAGAIPYFSKRKTLDLSGLTDSHIARREWKTWNSEKPGHAKFATRPYILSRRPDLILLHPWIEGRVPARPVFPLGMWPGYALRAMEIPGLTDEEGRDLYLHFWLREDRKEEAAAAGFLAP